MATARCTFSNTGKPEVALGGALAGEPCGPALSCDGGAACTGSQRICEAGSSKGSPCLRDAHCPGSRCISSGKVCNGGTGDALACVDDADPGGGICGARITPTPVPTRTPTPRPGGGCIGDCNGNGEVTLGEAETALDIFFEDRPLTSRTAADRSSSGDVSLGEGAVGARRVLLRVPLTVRAYAPRLVRRRRAQAASSTSSGAAKRSTTTAGAASPSRRTRIRPGSTSSSSHKLTKA